ncbi:uncharacterized protein UTRI_10439_B [Ustilago trichophora]|uniref:Uncharacterized protein n=1 Tax=Ustilago trichophora TaxID=86804 RepID=A0A5C3E8F7_9BASI|nr:uncharacterized protein UTRI_10439_B [Ustilago trichophora]
MKIQTRRLFFLLSGFVAFASVFAPINPDLPPEEKGMWEKAIEKYKEIHETQQRSYEPRDADFERYNRIERFEEKAWALAEQHGVFFVGKAQHRQPRPRIVEYFTSLVRPNDDLARDMNLRGKVALILWKRATSHTQELITVDSLTYHQELEWGLKPLRQIIGVH